MGKASERALTTAAMAVSILVFASRYEADET
jgi:hypothetical protein